MCLAIPGRITAIEKSVGRVEIGGIVREADLTLLPDAKVGDYVLLHAGFAIQKYDEEEAKETLRLLKEVTDAVSE
jgi:hydrogenase expression/formation protein HypC